MQNSLWTLRNLSDAGTKIDNLDNLMQGLGMGRVAIVFIQIILDIYFLSRRICTKTLFPKVWFNYWEPTTSTS